MADALSWGGSKGILVWVQIPPVAPIVIKGQEEKLMYYEYLSNIDVDGLSEYFQELSTFEEHRILSFENKKRNKSISNIISTIVQILIIVYN